MRNPKILMVLVLALGLSASLTGCGSNDDPVAPQNNTLTLDNETAEDFTLQALSAVNNIVSEIPDIANADFGAWAASKSEFAKVNTDTVTWDPAQSAWVFNYGGPIFQMDAPNYWNISLDLWVQYRNSAGALPTPEGATSMEVRYGTGMDMHIVEGQEVSDLAYDMNTHLTASYLDEGGAYAVVGSGDSVVAITQVGGTSQQSGQFAMDWTMDVAISDAGCPSGTATVNTEGWQLVATYDGQGNVNWLLNGPGYQGSGIERLGCESQIN